MSKMRCIIRLDQSRNGVDAWTCQSRAGKVKVKVKVKGGAVKSDETEPATSATSSFELTGGTRRH
ncbi:uncharacterized protein N7498_010588 [Penicillium cinerascens]|uniref:Uncharacterized protein n=1 Tax=Penicillium cinerascens TaxID=70096 RepID=A0A9W9M7B7_9EURO|nr:uncharacterized protein N7498_010588 [Penicillium cinerascens]KAJ5191603.1 hypothetical protein N7498_010588 [Penicillium cinerascens]